jgi:alpha-L-rhamnosidase
VATIYIPSKDAGSIKEGGGRISRLKGCKFLRMEKQAAVYEIGSGDYRFESKW